MTVEQQLHDGLRQLDTDAGDTLVGTFARYLRLLEKWNRAYNLTAVRDVHEMVERHVLDSLTARPFLDGVSIVDVGSGAGLPGLPLSMVEPARQFTLLDSGGKKIAFLRHVVAELSLDNVRIEQSRVEDLRAPDSFDTVISRAFSSLDDFVNTSGRLATAGGRLVAMKGRAPTEELQRLPAGWRAASITPVVVPGLAAQRHIIVLERVPR